MRTSISIIFSLLAIAGCFAPATAQNAASDSLRLKKSRLYDNAAATRRKAMEQLRVADSLYVECCDSTAAAERRDMMADIRMQKMTRAIRTYDSNIASAEAAMEWLASGVGTTPGEFQRRVLRLINAGFTDAALNAIESNDALATPFLLNWAGLRYFQANKRAKAYTAFLRAFEMRSDKYAYVPAHHNLAMLLNISKPADLGMTIERYEKNRQFADTAFFAVAKQTVPESDHAQYSPFEFLAPADNSGPAGPYRGLHRHNLISNKPFERDLMSGKVLAAAIARYERRLAAASK